MLGAALTLSEAGPVVAGFLVGLAIIMVASLGLIEPATTTAAGLDHIPATRSAGTSSAADRRQ